ncbi:hypothetical protein B4589_004620 [Halolamina sp. CBA1230]|uniref:hypothetical protein n=1 Tax=Halolamina sp. CBA1230 TaxID=1853690 RepID=UPI0009A147CF|nr:hypothetical protein [Halolamina sp. CBA1230]QKY19697.1 hypothetical protein B4589_004620 [Halolamina sp. CBA1230]
MEVIREETYRSTPELWPAADKVDSLVDESDVVSIQLQEREHYEDRLVVQINNGEGESTNRFEFDIASGEYRVCRYEGSDLPLIILHYVAAFGYYVEGTPSGPWGQYEYLVDAAGELEELAGKSDSPLVDYFSRAVSTQLQSIVVEVATHTYLSNQEFGIGDLVEQTDMSSESEVENVCGVKQLKKLPFSENTAIPEQLEELDLGPEVSGYDDFGVEGVNVRTFCDRDSDTIAVIVSFPKGVKYFKFNGQPGADCSIEYMDRRELPGLFLEDHLQNELDVTISTTPRLSPSDSAVDALNTSRKLLKSIAETDGLRTNPNNTSLEVAQLITEMGELYLHLEQIAPDDEFLQRIDDVCEEQTDTMGVTDLSKAPVDKFHTIIYFLGLASQRLDDEVREHAATYLEDKGLNDVDAEKLNLEDYVSSNIQDLSNTL